MKENIQSPFPKVTVYLVNHNYGKYIEQAIESVLAQSFQDFELLIIDNGSSDNSREIIERYIKHEKILTIFQENIGLNRTNNVAIDHSTGSYIMRLDADDYLHENALEVLSGALDRRTEAGLVFPDYFMVDEEGNVLDMIQRHDFNEVTLFDQPAHGACTMIRRECLLALDGYDESYHCQDGWDIWVRFIRRYGVTNVSLPLFYYRQHGSSLTRNEERILSTRSRIFAKQTEAKGRRLKSAAVIPIRGKVIDPGSVALRELGGKAVMDWTVESALEANRIERVMVTSPDPDVETHVKKRYGEEVSFFKRDWRLALPEMSLDATLTELFDPLPDEWRDFDALSLLYVETPFRTARYIDAAVDALDVFECNRVIGVRRMTEELYRHKGQGMETVRKSRLLKKEEQDLFVPGGGLMVIRRGHHYRDTDSDPRVGHVEVDEAATLHLSSEWRWYMATQYAEKFVTEETAG